MNFKALFKSRKPEFSYLSLDDIPPSIVKNVIYVIGEGKFKWAALFICPCGCGETIQLNLLTGGEDQWRVKVKRKLISISPSINRKYSCRAHFSIIRGQLEWFN